MQCESKAGIYNVEVQHSQPRASWESFESNVKAKPLYGSETWQLTRGLKKLHELSIKNLRNWWPRWICNEELWRQKGQQPVRQEIRQRAWRWIGHLLWPHRYKAKRAIEWNLQGKCKRENHSTPGGKQEWQSQKRQLTWWEVKHTEQKRVRWCTIPPGRKRIEWVRVCVQAFQIKSY